MVLAGGLGLRVGADRPKQLLDLGGRTVLRRSLDAFVDHPDVDRVVLVVPRDRDDDLSASVPGGVVVTEGGAERSDSTRAGLSAAVVAGAADDDRVLVHDAARPLVAAETISAVVEALDAHDVVALLVPTPDTIVRLDPSTGLPGPPIPRDELRRHQTPQGFTLGVLERAHREARRDASLVVTDDCTLVTTLVPEASVGVVDGDPRNLKITDPSDLLVARALLAAEDDTPR